MKVPIEVFDNTDPHTVPTEKFRLDVYYCLKVAEHANISMMDLVSKKQPLLNNKLKSYQKSVQGKAAFCLVHEFLDFFNLNFTISVYEPESYSGTGYKYEGRQKLISDLGISELDLNYSGPVLLQLLNIAQCAKPVFPENSPETADPSIEDATVSNGDINGINHNDDEETSKTKTDSNNLDSSDIVSNKNIINKLKSQSKIDLEIQIPRVTLNETYDIPEDSGESESSQSISSNDEKTSPRLETLFSPQSLESTKEETDKEDTIRETNSVPENISTGKDDSSDDPSKDEKNSRNSQTKSSNGNENSFPILKDKSPHDSDRSKLSPQKGEKLKPKGNLSSLSDLPPLPLGKSRMSDILPSPYNKEFKEKSNLKELDEMFDMQVEYEEDFMSSSEIDLSLNNKSDHKVSVSYTGKLTNDVGASSLEKTQGNKNLNSEIASDQKKSLRNNRGDDQKNKVSLSPGNSTSSISESLENDCDDSQLPK